MLQKRRYRLSDCQPRLEMHELVCDYEVSTFPVTMLSHQAKPWAGTVTQTVLRTGVCLRKRHWAPPVYSFSCFHLLSSPVSF